MTSSPRARDLGIAIGEGTPGPHNAITDVEGIRVGHTTLVSGDGPLVLGKVVNVLVAAETMTGRDGITAHRLPHDRLVEVMRRHGRLRV